MFGQERKLLHSGKCTKSGKMFDGVIFLGVQNIHDITLYHLEKVILMNTEYEY